MATHTIIQVEPSSSDFELHSFPSENPSEKKIEDTDHQDVTPPRTAAEVLQRWNSPRINMLRVFATFWSFFVTGMNDGSYGVSLSPYPKLSKADLEDRLWFRMYEVPSDIEVI
jgi:hypothetical protein